MHRRRSFALFAILCALAGGARADARDEDGHRFAIIGHGFTDGGEKRLRQALRDNDDKLTSRSSSSRASRARTNRAPTSCTRSGAS